MYKLGTSGWSTTFGGIPTRMAPQPVSTALGTALVVGGFLVGVDVTNYGGGYTNAPRVRVIGGGGTGTVAVAIMTNGYVASVKVTSAGSGYTNTPVVVIDPPSIPTPVASVKALLFGPNTAPVIQLNLTGLAPYDPYQVDFMPGLTSVWAPLGDPFVPTSTTNSQYANGILPTGYFRIRRIE